MKSKKISKRYVTVYQRLANLWTDIETVPRDDSRILVTDGKEVDMARSLKDGTIETYSCKMNPFLWQKLPVAPTGSYNCLKKIVECDLINEHNHTEATEIFNQIMDVIYNINPRDWLMFKVMYEEKLSSKQAIELEVKDILEINDFNLRNNLQNYVNHTENIRKSNTLFITREGKPIYRTHLQKTFYKANNIVNPKKRLTVSIVGKLKKYEELT